MRKALTGIALVVGAAVLTALASRGHHMKAKIDVASVERDIREHLPIGSSRADVSSFLDQRKIMHSHIGDELAAPDNNHTEMAMIRNVSQKAGVRGDIQILFKFDATDSKLVSYSVRKLFTGP